MQKKIYFVVGTIISGTNLVSVDLVNSLKNNKQQVVLRKIGVPARIDQAGLKTPEETLEKIKSMLDEDANKHTVFVGWRIPDHICQIYETYKNSATFIFTDPNSSKDANRSFLEQYVSQEDLDNIVSFQKQSIADFLIQNSITLHFQTVGDPVFDDSLSPNIIEEEGLRIAILGSL